MATILDLSIIIPAYNEAENIHTMWHRAKTALDTVPIAIEWLLVDDGSTDQTWSEINALAAQFPNIVTVQHDINFGLGTAIWSGVQQASKDWCTWIPADGQIPAESILEMLQLTSEANIVLLMRDEHQRTFFRRMLSVGLSGFINALFGFDPTGYTGIYLIRRSLLKDMKHVGSTAVQNYLIPIQGIKIHEEFTYAQTVIQPRISGSTKYANLNTILTTFVELIRLRFIL